MSPEATDQIDGALARIGLVAQAMRNGDPSRGLLEEAVDTITRYRACCAGSEPLVEALYTGIERHLARTAAGRSNLPEFTNRLRTVIRAALKNGRS